jgi:predicted alpha/beta superfamily hydrolase
MHVRFGVAAVLMLVTSEIAAQSDGGRASAAAPLSIGETFTIESAVLGETRRINVYAPSAYSASPDARLPVLYMPDGGIGEDFLHIAGLVQIASLNGTMRPFLLVGIENTERRRDLTGPTRNPDDRKIAPRVGGSADFRQFIRTELMPVIQARYRTTGETAIMGESLAGLFVVETFFLEPDLFDTYIAFDPSLWWNDRELVDSASARLERTSSTPRALYLASSSEEELAQLTGTLATAIAPHASGGLTVHHQSMPDETHASIYHPAALLALRRMFKPEPGGD